MITISLFYYWKKMFIFMNTWMIEKKVMKHCYLKRKIFTVTLIMCVQKEFVKNLK